ncbi:YdcF family protein [Micrococcaceae bacterium Sec5.7]
MNPRARRTLPAARNWFIAVFTVVLLWLIFSFQLFVNVDPLSLHRTDAVIMLGGAGSERLPVAQEVQRELNIPVLVLSHTDTPGNAEADTVCSSTTFPNASLMCFRPDDFDTRGEARAVGKLVADNGWKSVTVVTSTYHVTRAERLMEQCTTAEVQMVASHPDLDPGQWLRRFVIETGGLVDVSFRPEC